MDIGSVFSETARREHCQGAEKSGELHFYAPGIAGRGETLGGIIAGHETASGMGARIAIANYDCCAEVPSVAMASPSKWTSITVVTPRCELGL